MSNPIRLLGVLAAVSLAVAAGIISFDFFQVREKFPPSTFIGEVNVSGLDQSRAVEKLRSYKISEVFAPLITFEVENDRFSFSPDSIGVYIDYDKTVRGAFEITHKKGYFKELRKRLTEKALYCPPVLGIDEGKLNDLIGALADEIRSSARDASILIYEETGGYHIEPDNPGREVKKEETIAETKKRLAEGKKTFPIIVDYQYPAVTEKDLRAFPPVHRLSAFTTYYGKHDSPNRIHNIKLVASWIDGKLLLPGDVFSVADTLGEITPDRGFKEAFVIVKGELVPLLGGGSCQIATTLYNTVQLADLKVLQRQNHSMYFNIYPLGRDAGVYPGQLDFKFENDTGHPILIKAVATNRRLSFRIYGTTTGKKVTFSSPSVWMLTASGYRPATVRQVLSADAPFKTSVIRTVFGASGEKIKDETITSAYKLYGEKTNVPIARPEPR